MFRIAIRISAASILGALKGCLGSLCDPGSLYNVQRMKRYPMAIARERLADVLDEAERNGSVVIERRDVQYEIRARRLSGRRRPKRSMIETLDPAVADGRWTWNWTASGVTFGARRKRS